MSQSSPYILPLQNPDFVNSALSCGIAVLGFDDEFTVLEANDAFFRLLGCTRADYWDLYQNKALRTMHPADIEPAVTALLEQMENRPDDYFSVNSRIMHKDGDYRTIAFSGRAKTNDQGELAIFLFLNDVTEHTAALAQLQHEQTFTRLISRLSDDAFLDCDLLSGIARLSPNFSERFALTSPMYGYPASLLAADVVAPDSVPFFEGGLYLAPPDMSALAQGDADPSHTDFIELHLHDTQGQDVWYACHYSVLYDRLGIPVRMVARLSDVSLQHVQIHELTEQAQKDQLTGLYNKMTTEHLIKTALQNHVLTGFGYALFIIDVDNFKDINDQIGHQYGDHVLRELSVSLKQIFRAGDVIGRVGGDEFFVFLENYRDIEIVARKAQEICAAFRNTYEQNGKTVSISSSIGIALCPEHGVSYDHLYQRADVALYAAKERGKNGFVLFDHNLRSNYRSTRTKIDPTSPTETSDAAESADMAQPEA